MIGTQNIECFFDRIKTYGDTTAVITKETGTELSISYRRLVDDSYAIANEFLHIGIINKRIIIACKNSYVFYISGFACLLNNNVIIPISSGATTKELLETADWLEADYIFSSQPIFREKCDSVSIGDFQFQMFHCKDCGYSHIISDEIAFVFLTSGSTGKQKGVMHSLTSVLGAARLTAEYLPHIGNTLLLMPLNHIYGYCAISLPTFMQGGTLILSDGILSLYDDLKEYELDFLFVVPAVAYELYEKIKDLNDEARTHIIGRHLRTVACGGAKLNSDYVRHYTECGIKLINGYGSTEMCGCVSLTDGETIENYVGKVFPEYTPLARDGIIWMNTPYAFKGYFPDENPAFSRYGICTNDLGECIEHSLYIFGRNNDSIVLKNGEKVDIQDLQQSMLSIQNVHDVTFGVEDGFLCAVVTASYDDEESLAQIKEQIVAINRVRLPSQKVQRLTIKNRIK